MSIQQTKTISVTVYEIINHDANTTRHPQNIVKDYGYSLRKYTYHLSAHNCGHENRDESEDLTDECKSDYDSGEDGLESSKPRLDQLFRVKNRCDDVGHVVASADDRFQPLAGMYSSFKNNNKYDTLKRNNRTLRSCANYHNNMVDEVPIEKSEVVQYGPTVHKITRKFKHTRVHHKSSHYNDEQRSECIIKQQLNRHQDTYRSIQDKRDNDDIEGDEDYDYTEAWYESNTSGSDDNDEDEIIEEDIYEEGCYEQVKDDITAWESNEFDICEEDTDNEDDLSGIVKRKNKIS